MRHSLACMFINLWCDSCSDPICISAYNSYLWFSLWQGYCFNPLLRLILKLKSDQHPPYSSFFHLTSYCIIQIPPLVCPSTLSSYREDPSNHSIFFFRDNHTIHLVDFLVLQYMHCWMALSSFQLAQLGDFPCYVEAYHFFALSRIIFWDISYTLFWCSSLAWLLFAYLNKYIFLLMLFLLAFCLVYRSCFFISVYLLGFSGSNWSKETPWAR